MRPLAIASILGVAAFFASPVQAQTYFARQSMSGMKRTVPAVPSKAKCGGLVRGDWFVEIQKDTGLRATTLAEAQTACNSLAIKGAGTCGWSEDTFFPASFRNKIYWTTYVGARRYNVDPDSQGITSAVECPLN